MSGDMHVDPAFEAWLREELDEVPEPVDAVHAAVDVAARTRQRVPLRLRLRRLFGGDPHGESRSGTPTAPETVLWADDPRSSRGRAPSAVTTVGSESGLPLPIAVAALAVALVIAVAAVYLALGPGSPFFAGAGASPTPLRQVDPPVDGGRDLAVAADASGHFTTIGEAVAYATAGDRIQVEPGTYHERIDITKDISITGLGGRDGVIIRADESVAWDRPDGDRYVFRFDDVEATLSGLTVYGYPVGSAIVVEGGAPELDDLVITADGDQKRSNSTEPRQAALFLDGTEAVLTNSWTDAFVAAEDGASPTIRDTTLEGTCLRIDGAGVAPLVQDSVISHSACPGFSIVVSGGARPMLQSNTITNDPQTDGIRVVGEGSRADITSQVITGGDYGIWVATGAEAIVRRTLVSDATTGVGVSGAEATLDTMDVRFNDTGLLIDNGAIANLVGNVICENGTDIDQRVDPPVSTVGNEIGTPCPAPVATSAGS